ncbi:SDR family NAD(P)-dependent oxidoreductase [Nocardiopsis potens]|uniref:SDR family NAD(P)-dependent oxidoreductase n=1 Tax=Nocardiopsis potens TaxID=1246458 RepID=UPI00034958E8|nr:glucose 1-dehydrogenase [Nocardiopsis potens]
MPRFTDKVVLVTGGNSGMGRAVAERLAAEGAAVVLGARRKDLGDQVAAEIRAGGGRAVFVPADVTVEEDAARLVQAAIDEFGRLDGAFNNVGGMNGFGPVPEISDSAWRADLDVNLTSVFYGLKYQLPAILAAGGGAVLNNASNLGVTGTPTVAPYVAAKHGVVGLTRAAALENAGAGVRVNALVTGGVDTPLFAQTMGATPEGRAQVEAMLPVGRIAQPDEIAAFAAFLLSDESRFITGAALAIDGGITAQ